jgi:hypothetical protein
LKKHLFILKVIVVAILTSNGPQSFAQPDVIEKTNQSVYIYFYFLGLGSNIGMFEPTFRLTQTKFSYTKEQNSSRGNASKKIRRISSGTFRQSSIDSIIYLVKSMKDSTIFKSNPCIQSGGVYYLTVANGTDTTKFELMNTMDYTALKIIKVINEYLPSKKQIWASEKLIKDEEDCLTDLQKKANNYKK